MSKLRLIVNGVEYSGWLSARATRSIETIAGSFELEISEKWNGQKRPWPIRVEDECTVQLDDDIILTGAVDRVRRRFDKESHTVSIEGRDRAAVLVDCTPVLTQAQFSNIGVLEFCQMLADPFGITVMLQDGVSDAAISTTSPSGAGGGPAKPVAKRAADVGSAGRSSTATKIGTPKARLTVDPGETAFSLIDQACRLSGLLPVSDGLGNVVLTRASVSQCATAIVEGKNLLSGEITLDATKRYARYIVSGQAQGDDADDEPLNAASVFSTKAHGIDAGVVRTERTLLVRAEGAVTQAFANMRADWEATIRAGRSIALDLAVQGWRQGDGSLWPINALVPVTSPTLGVDDALLISSVTYAQSEEQGTTTRLSVTRPDAFSPEPTVAGGKALQAWWGVKGGNG